MESRPYVYVEHVKGEGSWGRKRNAPINDGVADIIEKYLGMRAKMILRYGIPSDAMFPSLRESKEFTTQQNLSKIKGKVQRHLGVPKFELKDGRRAYGQRMLDRGVPIENVSYCMGHDSIATTQKFYANYREKRMLDGVYNALGGDQVPNMN